MRAFTAIDAALAVAMICGAIAAFATADYTRPDRVIVHRQNTIIAEYPLRNDVSFTVNGKNGTVGIEIKNGAVRIGHAACPKGICKRTGAISNQNGQLICAPNNIMVQILSAGGGNNRVDGVTY
jgi:hypothetical protein